MSMQYEKAKKEANPAAAYYCYAQNNKLNGLDVCYHPGKKKYIPQELAFVCQQKILFKVKK